MNEQNLPQISLKNKSYLMTNKNFFARNLPEKNIKLKMFSFQKYELF